MLNTYVNCCPLLLKALLYLKPHIQRNHMSVDSPSQRGQFCDVGLYRYTKYESIEDQLRIMPMSNYWETSQLNHEIRGRSFNMVKNKKLFLVHFGPQSLHKVA